jgi:ribose 5-phosphate isomerase RpiB
MRVAVVNEVSAKDKNGFILNALKKCGAEIVNAGMSQDDAVELTYIHTGLISAILLNLGAVDLVVGGCGTGQGFLISVMQYPNVFCGLLTEPLDAWLFGKINGGNCVSLPLNKGFGWAGGINLEYIFEKLFCEGYGEGYPPEREQSQRKSRAILHGISKKTHADMKQILAQTDKDILDTIFAHQPFVNAIKGEVKNKELQKFIIENYLV